MDMKSGEGCWLFFLLSSSFRLVVGFAALGTPFSVSSSGLSGTSFGVNIQVVIRPLTRNAYKTVWVNIVRIRGCRAWIPKKTKGFCRVRALLCGSYESSAGYIRFARRSTGMI